MTTMASFYSAFADLSVTGVTSLANPPLKLDSVRLPCKWVDSLTSENRDIMAKTTGRDRTLRCRVVIAINPPGQDLYSSRWTDIRAMSDTLDTAIKAMTRPTRGVLSWNVDVTPNLDGSGVYAITAEVEAMDIGG